MISPPIHTGDSSGWRTNTCSLAGNLAPRVSLEREEEQGVGVEPKDL
jgi:hypothetical protein